MSKGEYVDGSGTRMAGPDRRRFLQAALIAGGALLLPPIARVATAATIRPSRRKPGHVIVFADARATPPAHAMDALGHDWTPVADQAAAHACAAACDGESLAVIGIDAGIVDALAFARGHADVKAVFAIGSDHGGVFDAFQALQAPRGYAVQLMGAMDSLDWHHFGRCLDRRLA